MSTDQTKIVMLASLSISIVFSVFALMLELIEIL